MSFKNKILLVIKALLWDGSKKLPSIPAPQRAGYRQNPSKYLIFD